MKKKSCGSRKTDGETLLVMGLMAVMGAVGSFALVCGMFDIAFSEIGVRNGIGIVSAIAFSLFAVLLLGRRGGVTKQN